MRILFIFTLMICSNAFAQSKKELRLELEKANLKADSMNKALIASALSNQKKTDSLQLIIDDTQKRLNAQCQFTHKQEESINKCTSRNLELRLENERLRESLSQPQSKSKTQSNKELTSPFSVRGGRVSEHGKAYGLGNDEGGIGRGEPYNSRSRLSEANISTIQSTEKGLIALLLTIDAEGKVIQTTVNEELTTIKNKDIIQQVIACVERDVKYEISVNAQPIKVNYFVKILL